MTSVARGRQRDRTPQITPGMRLWGRWTVWRVERMLSLDRCRHDGRAPMCWACVLLCCRIR